MRHHGGVKVAADPYDLLGVPPDATPGEIVAAFRIRAKHLHPDAARDGRGEGFRELVEAYRIVGDPVERARFDARRAAPAPPPRPAPAPPATPARGFHLSLRWARRAFAGGLVMLVLGVAAAYWVLALQRHDSRLRGNGEVATATVVGGGGGRELVFTTQLGQPVRAAEPAKSGSTQPSVGSRVRLYYDPAHPTDVTLATSHAARDITLWIVAVKCLVGGGVLTVLGARRLRAT